MQDVLKALNELVAGRLIEGYAIGGAIGASFYIDALQTEDVDAFVFLPGAETGLVSRGPIYRALAALGGVPEREYVRFGDWPLQILTDANALITEAITEAAEVHYAGVPTRVFRPEHLCAVAIQTGRAKDILRISLFIERGAVDMTLLRAVLSSHRLEERATLLLPTNFGAPEQ